MSARREEELQPCGTHASYRRHLRHGEEACPDCRRAHAAYVATFRGSGASYKQTIRQLPRCGREVAA